MSSEPVDRKRPSDMILVTGLSGAGRSTALKYLEDLGYETVDNLPANLALRLTGSIQPGQRLAIGMDSRTRGFSAPALDQIIQQARLHGHDPYLLFLTCDDEVLARRFTETRRRHPLAEDRAISDGIAREHEVMHDVKAGADWVIDTTRLNPGELKTLLRGAFASESSPGMVVTILSFSYRHGLPREADMVFDARFLRNPHYDPMLKPLSGRDAAVGDYIAHDSGFGPFFDGLTAMTERLLPGFAKEGKTYVTIAIGCTGGRHRSVYIAERLAAWLRLRGHALTLHHRDLVIDNDKQGAVSRGAATERN